jgi:hypothetical protein
MSIPQDNTLKFIRAAVHDGYAVIDFVVCSVHSNCEINEVTHIAGVLSGIDPLLESCPQVDSVYRPIGITLPLSGRQGAWGGEVDS